MAIPVWAVLKVVRPVRHFGSVHMVEQFVEDIAYDDATSEGGIRRAGKSFLERGRVFMKTCVEGIFRGRKMGCGLLRR